MHIHQTAEHNRIIGQKKKNIMYPLLPYYANALITLS